MGPPAPRSAGPLFLALGRLAEYKRIDLLLRLWDRVRPVMGGRLVVAGDGPQHGYLESLAGPGVSFAGGSPRSSTGPPRESAESMASILLARARPG